MLAVERSSSLAGPTLHPSSNTRAVPRAVRTCRLVVRGGRLCRLSTKATRRRAARLTRTSAARAELPSVLGALAAARGDATIPRRLIGNS